MTSPDEFFKQVIGGYQSREEREEIRQENFEETCVKRLLKLCGYPLRVALEKGQSHVKHGSSSLDFAWLEAEFPLFPARMSSWKLRDTSGTHIGWNHIIGDGFTKCPWIAAYKEAAARCDWDVHNETCVLLFNAPKAKNSSIVALHNQPGVMHHPEGTYGARIVAGVGKPRIEYVLERLNNLVYTLGTDWVEERCQE